MNYTEKRAKNRQLVCSHFLLIFAFCCLNLLCRLFAGARLRVFLPGRFAPRPRLPPAVFLPAAPLVTLLEALPPPPLFWMALLPLLIFKGYLFV